MGNLLVNQNLNEAINSNTYVDWVLAVFYQQLTSQSPGTVVVSWSIFIQAIEEYEIPPVLNYPKMANLYLGTSNPSEHLDNYTWL